MSDIQVGDWVTATGKGPYEVLEADTDSAWLYVQTPHGVGMLLSDWCEKVPVPFRPEISSLWQDREDNVWQCIRLETSPGVLGTLMHRLVDNVLTSIEEAHAEYGPMVQLVPKEKADD